jgi:hypothetical protein
MQASTISHHSTIPHRTWSPAVDRRRRQPRPFALAGAAGILAAILVILATLPGPAGAKSESPASAPVPQPAGAESMSPAFAPVPLPAPAPTMIVPA